MDERKAVAQAIDLLERVQADLAAVATRDDERRRHDMIEYRRRLSAQIAEVGRVCEPLIAATGNAALLQAYRARFSRMRSMAAMHQASWPAVSLGEREDEYRDSALGVREANREFVTWMRETLAQLR